MSFLLHSFNKRGTAMRYAMRTFVCSEQGGHPNSFIRMATPVLTCVFELGVFAAHLHSHGRIGAVAVAPEPVVLSVEGGDDLALVPSGAAAFLIGDRVAASMAMHFEVHAATLDEHPVFHRLTFFHHQLPFGTVTGGQGGGDLVAPDLDVMRVCRADEVLRCRSSGSTALLPQAPLAYRPRPLLQAGT